MKIDTWEKVESIFHTAIELSFEERKPFLQTECGGNRELLSEIESLINSFEQDSYILDESVFEIGLGAIAEKSEKNLVNSTIGFYKVQEKIGAGGMGEVYKAIDTKLNRPVALKFLSESLENDNQAKRRLINEAQAVAMLEHPNICAIHGIEETGKHHFIVMQFIEGKTLGDSFQAKAIGAEVFKSIARQILDAVAFAHSHGVIHRDLKPGNIMLDRNGSIKVLDFGLAKIIPQNRLWGGNSGNELSQVSNSGLVIGTVSYMSPEQLRGKKLDYRSDIFSIGIILFELLAKQNPFNRESQAEVIAAILSSEPPKIKQFTAGFPVGLTNLVEKCLQKNPAERFQSVAEMLVELDSAKTENVIGIMSKRRKNLLIRAVFAVVILFTILSSLYFYNVKQPQRTLAILPIAFNNSEIEKEYLAEGLTQSIIEKLSDLSELKVKSRYAVADFKGKTNEPQKAGKELNVDAVYVGSIIKRDNSLFLVTKLIRTSDSFVIDTNQVEIDESRLIELQDEVAGRIINKIKSDLTDEDQNKLAKKDTENEEAKRLYYVGRYNLNRKNSGDIKNAIRLFTQATDLDPLFAKAWAGLAEAYLALSLPGAENAMLPKDAANSAKYAAKKALDLDNNLCESHNSLGMISLKYDWKWEEAETFFRAAIERDPEFVPARVGLINVLSITGRNEDSLAEAKKLKEIAPLSMISYLELAKVFYRKADYSQMDKVLSDLLDKFPNNNRIAYIQCYKLIRTGKLDEAIEILEKMYQSENEADRVFASAPLGFAYAKKGERNKALKIIENLEVFANNSYVSSQEKAVIYIGLGNFDKAFENLDKSCAEKFQSLPAFVTDPLIEEIKNDARFINIKKCVNL